MSTPDDLLADVLAELRARVAWLAGAGEVAAAVAEEPLSEAVVEAIALAGPAGPAGAELLPQDLRAALVADLAGRLRLLPWHDALEPVGAALPDLLDGDRFARLLAAADLDDAGMRPRLAEAARWVTHDAQRLRKMHAAEWCGADLAIVAAGGADLVLRVARLLLGAELVRAAAADDGRAGLGDLAETIARRFAWRWLRDPAPEAATAKHRARSAELLRGV